MIPEIKKFRKELHQHPELSDLEFNTANRVRSFIETHHPTKIIDKIGETGLAAIYEFSKTGPTIAIRCELDALPIEEENQFNYRSKQKGVSHKCGHDGHMSIVAGLIFWIKEQSFKTGKIILLFQPAEETGKGAFKVLEDERFQQLGIDYIFALHNIPGESLHSVITMSKGFSAEVQSFSISVMGKKSHAAEPENGINPAIGISKMINELSKLNIVDPLNEDFAILTPVFLNMGQKSYGVSPANGELHYTIRTWSTDKMERLKIKMEDIFKRIGESKKLKYEVNWFEHFPASQNDFDCNNLVLEAAKSNGLEVVERPYPFKFGEDFGWFSKKHKTAMFGLGAGKNCPALHHANYDFPDEIIETGMDMFKAIINKIMNESLQ